MKRNPTPETKTVMFPSSFRHESQRWGGGQIRSRSSAGSAIKTLRAELMATQQFDCGRWKLRLERVPLSTGKQAKDGHGPDEIRTAI